MEQRISVRSHPHTVVCVFVLYFESMALGLALALVIAAADVVAFLPILSFFHI